MPQCEPISPLHQEGYPPDVRIWLVRCAVEPEELMERLTPGERRRLAALRQPADRARFAATRAAVRELLGHELGVAPAAVGIGTGPRGKPYVESSIHGTLDASRIVFNASHAGDYALIAIGRAESADAPRLEVGVDIERVDAQVDTDSLLALVLGPDDVAQLTGSSASRRQAFFRVWTAKEAFFKALGDGIGDQLPNLSVRLPAAGTNALSATSTDANLAACAQRMTLHSVDVPEGYVATLAVLRNAMG